MSKTHRRYENKIQQNIGCSAQKGISQQSNGCAERSASKIRLWVGLLTIVCTAVLAAHWPALSTKATFFDDGQYLTENQLMQNPSWTSARRFLTEVLEPSTVRGYYQPLAMISLMADYALGGRLDNLRPFHRTSLTLHIANTALVIVLLYLLFGQAWVAAGVGLLFGLHPMTVESICWLSDRKTLLAAFFALWCLILYVRFTRKGNRKLYIGCMVMYVLALMSKPTSTPLPLLMLLMDFWPLGRLKRRAILEKLPLFMMGGVFAVITYISQSRTAGVTTPGKYGLERILLTLCHNIIFYPYKIVWPVNLSSHYAYPQPLELSNSTVLAGVIGTCILIPLLVISLRWTKAILTGWLFFFVAIFPTMGVVGFTNVIASDKFAYLPSTGLLMVLASFLCWQCDGINKLTTRRIVVIITVLVLAGAEAVATRRYLVYWRDSVSLNEHMLTLTPDAAPVHYELGYALQLQGSLDQAISHYNKTLLINPNHVDAHNNLGIILLGQGKPIEAINHFRQALHTKPKFAKAHNNLAWILATNPDPKLRDASKAIELAERAAKLTNYQNAEILDTLAAAYASAGQFDRAVATAQTAVTLASAAENNELATQVRERLQLYRQAKPYLEPAQSQNKISP